MGKQDTLDSKTQRNIEILFALMAMSSKSDRVIAKNLGISNTTLSKRRRKLEQEGYIKEYAIIPDFRKMGIELIAFSFSSTNDVVTQQQTEEARELLQRHPEVLCVLDSPDDNGTKWITISVHKNYDGYIEYFRKVQKEFTSLRYQPPHVETHTFVITTGKQYLKPFSFRNMSSLIFQSTKPLHLASAR